MRASRLLKFAQSGLANVAARSPFGVRGCGATMVRRVLRTTAGGESGQEVTIRPVAWRSCSRSASRSRRGRGRRQRQRGVRRRLDQPDEARQEEVQAGRAVLGRPHRRPTRNRRRSRTRCSEYLSYPKNVKFDFNAGDVCTTLPPSGSTPQQARDACPADSFLGAGVAEVQGPGVRPDHGHHRLACSAARRRTGSSCTPRARRSAPPRRRCSARCEVGRRQRVRSRAQVPDAPETRRADDHQVQRDHHQGEQGHPRPLQGQDDDLPAQGHVRRRHHETAETTQKCKQKKKKGAVLRFR